MMGIGLMGWRMVMVSTNEPMGAIMLGPGIRG